MNKLTALMSALLALALMTGPAVAGEMMGNDEPASISKDLRMQLSPNIFGYIADGVADDEFRGPIDTHYGVAPEWMGTEGPLMTVERDLRRQLSPNIVGYIADGVAHDEFRGPVDTHYGVAPVWGGSNEKPLERELRKHLSPTVIDEYFAY